MNVTLQVICRDLPGATWVDAEGGEPPARERIHLGIQKGESIVEAVPASKERVVFEPVFRVSPLPGGGTNFLGPFAKGTPAERFFYLSWAVDAGGGELKMFRRAKVHLSHLPWLTVEKAATSGTPLRVELSMTDERGGPLCGSVRGRQVRWDL